MNLMYFAVVIIIIKNMYLLTEWEGWMGKYLVQGHGIWTKGHDRVPNIFPSGLT